MQEGYLWEEREEWRILYHEMAHPGDNISE
jgi:hypothetical protein